MENIQQCYPERRSSSVFYHNLYRPNPNSLQLSFGCKDVNGFSERYVQAVELSVGGEVLGSTGIEDPMVGIAFLAGLAVCLDASTTDHIRGCMECNIGTILDGWLAVAS